MTVLSSFVNSRQYATHPLYASLVEANPSVLSFTPSSPSDTAQDRKAPEYVREIVQHASVTHPVLPDTGLSIPRPYLHFEQNIEQSYLQRLQNMCQNEMLIRNERLSRARGFLGLGADWEEVKKLEAQRLESCDKLRSLGYRI